MKNKKNILKIVLYIGIIFIIVLVSSFWNKDKKEIQIEVKNGGQEIPEVVLEKKDKLKSSPTKESFESVTNILAHLNVFDKSYSIKIKEGANVYDAMKSISDNSFTFKGRDHAGLGYFVEEINDVKGAPGRYWIYYVNDKEANVGISKYVLKDGDIISWKNEGM